MADQAGSDAPLTIGQLAERTGFTTSTLRYYERQGLVFPVARTSAGYRLYDERSVERLRFVARAKQLGCPLDEIVDLVGLLSGDCGPVQAKLHTLVGERIGDAERRSAELAQFGDELRAVARSLDQTPVDGPCRAGCACLGATSDQEVPDGPTKPGLDRQPVTLGRHRDSEPDRDPEPDRRPQVVCSLAAEQVADRLDDWRRLLEAVTRRTSLTDGLRLDLDPTVSRDDLLRLTMAEQDCCAFFSFAITIDGRGLGLEVRAPEQATEMLAAVFGRHPAGTSELAV